MPVKDLTQSSVYTWLGLLSLEQRQQQLNLTGEEFVFIKKKKHKNVGSGQSGKLSRQMFALQMIVAH